MRTHIPLTFPATRKALWCHTAIGLPITLLLPRVSVSVTEQVLYLVNGHARSSKVEHCRLCGEVRVEADCSELVLHLNQFDASPTDSQDIISDISVPTEVLKQSRHQTSCTVDKQFAVDSYHALTSRAKSGHKVRTSDFLSASAICTVFSGSNQIHADLDVDVLIPSTKFDLTPIESVSVAMTALSKSVLGADRHGVVSGQIKSGYLTMDQYRKVVFLLDSDPKVLSVPIIGIWVSGVELISDPYVWSSCMRYQHTSQITDRVNKPSDPFLLIHKSPLTHSAQFYDCLPNSTALTFKLMSGSHGFSMAKETGQARKGLLSVKLEHQDLRTAKGRQVMEHFEEIALSMESENKMYNISKVPQTKRSVHVDQNLDDSLPRTSPFPVKPAVTGVGLRPSVPDVSFIEDCTPQQAPKPERLAFRQIWDNQLNHSPPPEPKLSNEQNVITYRPQRSDHTVRRIEFDDGPLSYESNHNLINTVSSKPVTPRPSTPSLRSCRPINNRPTPTRTAERIMPSQPHLITPPRPSPVAQNSAPDQLLSTFHSSAPQPTSQNLAHPTEPTRPVPTTINHHLPHRNPNVCSCQCQYYGSAQAAADVPPSTTRANNAPLSVITDNVMKLLSPRPTTLTADAVNAGGTQTPPLSDQVNISPIENIEQRGVMLNTPSSHSGLANSQMSSGMSPEVQQILQQQDQQLKALQLQIQKLLKAQEVHTAGTFKSSAGSKQSIETQTEPLRKCVDVNTGVSLLAPMYNANEVGVDSYNSTNDSSRSQSLIQHDLTTLDLPTQVTARSFASDINVDYESYDDSPSGSPQRDGSGGGSEASWQSPVLGESVSMIAESTAQESSNNQLHLIVKNVRDLLSRHLPGDAAGAPNADITDSDGKFTEQSDVKPAELHQLPPPPEELMSDTSSSGSSVLSEAVISDSDDSDDNTKLPTTSSTARPMGCEKSAQAVDVATATRNQLRKFGIDIASPAATCSDTLREKAGVGRLPRLEYVSMMMSESVISESNRSLELNALALKYLQDDQLAELAQFTVHRHSSTAASGQTSLLRQVLTYSSKKSSQQLSSQSVTNSMSANMSIATRQYLKRYALTDSDVESYDDSDSVAQVFDDEPSARAHLKSILRHTTLSTSVGQASGSDQPTVYKQQLQEQQPDDGRVLDIVRLKELPKLL